MIPKIIHYCWFGPKKYSRTVKKCMETWHRLMPDYEFMLWNESNSPMDHPFVRSAYAAMKYAFVADYVRFWALYNYGGIYLDTDMYVVKRFDELLKNECFAGYEHPDELYVSCGIWGAIPHHTLFKTILGKYENVEYCPENIEQLIVPRLVTPLVNEFDGITIYPSDYFYPFPYEKRMERNFLKYQTDNTYAIHLWNLSWKPLWQQYLSFAIKEYKTFFFLKKK